MAGTGLLPDTRSCSLLLLHKNLSQFSSLATPHQSAALCWMMLIMLDAPPHAHPLQRHTTLLQETHGVSTRLYGQGAARTTADLLEEVDRAESVLTVDPSSSRALRLINVVNLYIMNDAGQVCVMGSSMCRSDGCFVCLWKGSSSGWGGSCRGHAGSRRSSCTRSSSRLHTTVMLTTAYACAFHCGPASTKCAF